MTNSANLPAPYLGVNEKMPLPAIESPYCENLFNFNVTQAGISLRNGDVKDTLYSGVAQFDGCGLLNYSNSYFVVSYDASATRMKIYSAGSLVYTSAASYLYPYLGFEFNRYLFLFSYVSSAAFAYDGTNWGVCGYTGSGFRGVTGVSFKNRAYIIQYDECAYWYSEISAISGALTKVNLSGITNQTCKLMGIAPITIADNVSAVTFLAFIMDNGEVLFYSGSYPNSSDWSLAGRGLISQPLVYNPYVLYQGDCLCMTDGGIVSLRDLFLKGSQEAVSLSVNSYIQETYVDLVSKIRVSSTVSRGSVGDYIHAIWHPLSNRLIFSFGFYVDSNGTLQSGAFYFVFNCELKSWSFHRSYGGQVTQMIVAQNKILISANSGTSKIMIWQKEGSTGFMDRLVDDSADIAYDYTMLSAPIPFPKTAVYEATQIEPILESDLYAETNWNFVVDFGRQTSGNQKTDASTTSVSKPAVNVAMQNITYVQVKMSGTTTTGKTIGLDLYSFNVWYNAGEIASR